MPWLPLSHASPAGECVLVGPDGRPQASNPKFPRRNGPADGWFLDARDLGPWRTVAERPERAGWIVLYRGALHPDDPGIALLVVEISSPADGPSRGSWRWTPLPPWPRSAHARLEAARRTGLPVLPAGPFGALLPNDAHGQTLAWRDPAGLALWTTAAHPPRIVLL